jgi:ACS family tartrate transporter-like MFS transporter
MLGATEAGFLPGVVYYLTLWFPPSRRARYMAMFLIAGPLSFILGGPLSGAILTFGEFAGLRGWQWLFLLEGLPTLLLAFAAPLLLPNSLLQAQWLSQTEKLRLSERLQSENVEEHRELLSALRDFRITALGLVTFGILFGIYGTGLWLPQIVADMGYSPLRTGLVVAVPYSATIAVMILWGRSSDRSGERIQHTGLPLLIAAAAYASAAFAQNDTVSLLSLSVAVMALYSALAPLSSIPLTIFGGPAAAGAMALVFAISSLGAFFGPAIIGALRQQSGNYSSSMAALALVLASAGGLVLAIGRIIKRERVVT